MIMEDNKELYRKYEILNARLGEVQAMLNYYKRDKFNAEAQRRVVILKDWKEKLEKDRKEIKNKLGRH